MLLKLSKCPLCNRITDTLPTNNPLGTNICPPCLASHLDPLDLSQIDMWCRTYNIPFLPDLWTSTYAKCGNSPSLYQAYLTAIETQSSPLLWRDGRTTDLWHDANEEWAKCRQWDALLDRIEPLRSNYLERARLKWGADYTFDQYIQLDNLLISTLRATNISNPLQIDAIKKASRISLALDAAINAGDSKAIKDLSSSYATFTKTAQIDDIITASNKDVIATVADLGAAIEECGGQFRYYDNVERDIVDKSMNDLKEYLRTLVQESTNLGATLDSIAAQYRTTVEQANAAASTSATPIVDLLADNALGANAALDASLDSQDIMDAIADIAADADESPSSSSPYEDLF